MNVRSWGFKGTAAALLAASLIATAGCSGDSNSAGQEGTGKTTDTPTNHFKLWLGWTATVNNDSLEQQYWRKTKPGIDVQVEATQGDAQTALNLKLKTAASRMPRSSTAVSR